MVTRKEKPYGVLCTALSVFEEQDNIMQAIVRD